MTKTVTKQLVSLTVIRVATAVFISLIGASSAWAFEEELDALALNIGERISEAGKRTVAVVDFTDVRGNKTELGRFLAEEISVALLTSQQGFQLVDRAHLNKIMEEARLGESGIVDPETAKELGRIAGVDVLVTGTITPLEETVRVTVKVLETETATIIAGDRVSLSATGPIRELLARGLAGSPSASPGSAVHTRAYEMESREAGGLRFTVRAVRSLQDGKVATLIDVSNLNPYPVRIGLPNDSNNDSQCIDNNGNLFEQTRGLEEYFDCNDDFGLNLGPSESQQITELYRSSRGARDLQVGSVFQVTLRVKICKPQEKDRREGKIVQFSFSDLSADSVAAR